MRLAQTFYTHIVIRQPDIRWQSHLYLARRCRLIG